MTDRYTRQCQDCGIEYSALNPPEVEEHAEDCILRIAANKEEEEVSCR